MLSDGLSGLEKSNPHAQTEKFIMKHQFILGWAQCSTPTIQKEKAIENICTFQNLEQYYASDINHGLVTDFQLKRTIDMMERTDWLIKSLQENWMKCLEEMRVSMRTDTCESNNRINKELPAEGHYNTHILSFIFQNLGITLKHQAGTIFPNISLKFIIMDL